MLKSQPRTCSTSGAEGAVISGGFDIQPIGRFDRAFQITSNAFFSRLLYELLCGNGRDF